MDPFKPVYRLPTGGYPVAPLQTDPLADLMARLTQQKPEPSFAALGRAKAKGTGLEFVNPQMSPLTLRRYLNAKDPVRRLLGIHAPIPAPTGTPLPVPSLPGQPADDTAAPLTMHLQQWLRGR